MTLPQFNALPNTRQRVTVCQPGTFLASRLVGTRILVNLHQLSDDLFVEVYYDFHANQTTQLRAFTKAMLQAEGALYPSLSAIP